MIVDMHAHYYLPEYVEAVRSSDAFEVYIREDGRIVVLWKGGGTLTVPQPHPGPAERIEMMDRLGVGMQVLSVPSPSVYFTEGGEALRIARAVNDGLAGVVRSRPDRFRALAALPLKDIDDSLAELDRAAGELGMAGAMILTNIDGELLDSPRLEPFWERADELGALVYVHPPSRPPPGGWMTTAWPSPWASCKRPTWPPPGSSSAGSSSAAPVSGGCSPTWAGCSPS